MKDMLTGRSSSNAEKWVRGMNWLAKSVRLPLLLAIVLIGTAGCGLSDYQSRMDKSREWVKEFDDANRALDDPIEIPLVPLGPKVKPKEPPKDAPKEPAKEEADTKPAWLFDFYLRLPKGFGKMPKDKVPYAAPFPCFRYAGADPGYDILVAANVVADRKAKDKVEIGKYYADDFRFFVRLAIKDFYAKTNDKLDLKMPASDKFQAIDFPTLSPFSDVTTRIAYQTVEYTDKGNPKIKEPSVFRVYIHEEPARTKEDGAKEPGKQVAIVVHRPMRTDDTFEKACLRTLDIGDSMNKRSQYKKVMKR